MARYRTLAALSPASITFAATAASPKDPYSAHGTCAGCCCCCPPPIRRLPRSPAPATLPCALAPGPLGCRSCGRDPSAASRLPPPAAAALHPAPEAPEPLPAAAPAGLTRCCQNSTSRMLVPPAAIAEPAASAPGPVPARALTSAAAGAPPAVLPEARPGLAAGHKAKAAQGGCGQRSWSRSAAGTGAEAGAARASPPGPQARRSATLLLAAASAGCARARPTSLPPLPRAFACKGCALALTAPVPLAAPLAVGSRPGDAGKLPPALSYPSPPLPSYCSPNADELPVSPSETPTHELPLPRSLPRSLLPRIGALWHILREKAVAAESVAAADCAIRTRSTILNSPCPRSPAQLRPALLPASRRSPSQPSESARAALMLMPWLPHYIALVTLSQTLTLGGPCCHCSSWCGCSCEPGTAAARTCRPAAALGCRVRPPALPGGQWRPGLPAATSYLCSSAPPA